MLTVLSLLDPTADVGRCLIPPLTTGPRRRQKTRPREARPRLQPRPPLPSTPSFRSQRRPGGNRCWSRRRCCIRTLLKHQKHGWRQGRVSGGREWKGGQPPTAAAASPSPTAVSCDSLTALPVTVTALASRAPRDLLMPRSSRLPMPEMCTAAAAAEVASFSSTCLRTGRGEGPSDGRAIRSWPPRRDVRLPLQRRTGSPAPPLSPFGQRLSS